MKRGGPLKRTSPLKRKTELARGEVRSLRRRTRRPPADREAARAWGRGMRGKPCAVCGRRPSFGHHVIDQEELRKLARSRGLDVDRLLWDERNRLPVCEGCHHAHHRWLLRSSPTGRIPRAVLRRHCPDVFAFAASLGLEWWLEREYPSG